MFLHFSHYLASTYSLFISGRYEDVSTVLVRNSHLDLMDQDILYHLALGSGSHDLRAMFGDVKVKYNFFNRVNMSQVCFP